MELDSTHTPASEVAAAPESVPVERRAVILIVDDDESVLSALNRLLRRDYDLLLASGGKEALAMLESHDVDVIIADQRMPVMTGVDFLRQAKVIKPHVLRTVLSGYIEADSIAKAINEGAIYKFFVKPWDNQELRVSIAKACRYKFLADDNRRLTQELQSKNEELAVANALLQKWNENKRLRLVLDEKAMFVMHEIMQLLPWPLIGIDDAGMVAATNEACEELFSTLGAVLIGNNAADVLPTELNDLLARNVDNDEVQFTASGHSWQVRLRHLGVKSNAKGCLLIFMDRHHD